MCTGLEIYSRNLPHWRLDYSTYFLTWCLTHGLPGFRGREKDVVVESLHYFAGDRYYLWAHVVMDDHVHVVVTPYGESTLSKITHTWKSYTANQINKLRNRSGKLWQGETYDRIIRSEEDLLEKLEYVLTNPVRRWPGTCEYKWSGVSMEGFEPQKMKHRAPHRTKPGG